MPILELTPDSLFIRRIVAGDDKSILARQPSHRRLRPRPPMSSNPF